MFSVHSLNQEFYFVSSDVLVRLYEVYSASFYGSNLWNLFGDDCQRLYRSWNIAIRIACKVPRTTHCYLIEEMSHCLHPVTMLCSRFVKFHQTNMKCRKPVIKLLVNLYRDDLRTVYGRNLHAIAGLCDSSVIDICPRVVKAKVRYRKIPEEERWRVPIMREMLDAKHKNVDIAGLSNRDIDDILNFVCTI